MIDLKSLEKPEHVKAEIWRQHLNWMDVVGKQVDDNNRLRQRQAQRMAAQRRDRCRELPEE